MIPRSWTPVHRPSDGEHVGYLAPAGDDGRRVPTSLLGLPLDGARDRHVAEALLIAHGLASLDRRWWCRLPASLTPGLLSAAEPLPEWRWRQVAVVEVSPTGCSVRLAMAPPEEMRSRAALPVPVGDLLREHPPD